MEHKITAVIVIKDEALQLMEYFEHVRRFCDEIIAIDQHSTDASLALCLKHCDKVFTSRNTGYCEKDWEFASHQAKNDWICLLCPDERFENEFIYDLDKTLFECEENNKDSVQCEVHEYYDGIYCNEDPAPLQCRLFRKGLHFGGRIHSCVSFREPLATTYKQFHFKNYSDTMKKESVRQGYYDTMQRIMIEHFFSNLNSFLDCFKKENNQLIKEVYDDTGKNKEIYIMLNKKRELPTAKLIRF